MVLYRCEIVSCTNQLREERDPMKKRILSLLLAAAMLIAVLPGMGFGAAAASKEEPKRVIGIVFDNSGSMYYDQTWCRATYAMEVFAAMMNDGDQMQVYPMYPIEIGVGGPQYDMDNPLVINGPDEADTLRKINSPHPGNTPIEVIEAAYNGLKKAQADEKYLIVVTDGQTFYRNNLELGQKETQEELTKILEQCSQDLQVMYLGVGAISYPPEVKNPSRQVFKVAKSSSDTLDKLTELCNTIFGRNKLENVQDKITFDVSLSKLIVFVQGANVSGVSVSGGTKIREASTHYSESGTTEGGYGGGADTSLQGMLVTYGEFDAGSYDLSYTGNATNVSVYYEPDVDMYVRLVDGNGREVTSSSTDLYSGTYYLEYGMVDRDGNPTESELLGETKYELTYTINGEEFTETPTSSGKLTLELEANDVLDGSFKVTYLDDYTIEKDWAGSIQISPAPVQELAVTISGGSGTYGLTDLESEAVYDVKVTYGGDVLTGDTLKSTPLDISLTGGNAEYQILEYTDDSVRIGIGYCGGDPQSTDCGAYELTVTASYTDQDGQTANSQPAMAQFTIEDDTSSVAAEFQLEEDYYVQSKLNEAEPIRLVLSVGGKPLTAEQFGQVVVEEIDVDGLACDIQPDPDNSCYTIKIRTGEAELGKYKLSCRIQIPNEIGKLSEAKDSVSIQIQKYPGWVILVFWILIALIIATIIWAFLNTKVLPKRIGTGKCTFSVDGSNVAGSPTCVFVGGGKKRGSLDISSPRYAANPSASCGFRLELEADSPRRTKSAARSVKVRNVTALNPSTTFLKINTFKMIQDPVTEKLVRAVGKADAPIEFTIKNNSSCTVTAEVLDVTSGGTTPVNLIVNLKFF